MTVERGLLLSPNDPDAISQQVFATLERSYPGRFTLEQVQERVSDIFSRATVKTFVRIIAEKELVSGIKL